jgi:hypothetical protein
MVSVIVVVVVVIVVVVVSVTLVAAMPATVRPCEHVLEEAHLFLLSE